MVKLSGLGRGFTLVEVCVAVAVLATGLAALGCFGHRAGGSGLPSFVAGFGQLRSAERARIESVIEAVSSMEKLIESPPPCNDSLYALLLSPSFRQALAGAHLYYAETGDSLVRLRRIVRCR